jgi:hypothetical protein
VRDDNDKHPEKQSSPISVTEFGIVSDDNALKSLKHSVAIEATEFGTIKLFNIDISNDCLKKGSCPFVISKCFSRDNIGSDYYFSQKKSIQS